MSVEEKFKEILAKLQRNKIKSFWKRILYVRTDIHACTCKRMKRKKSVKTHPSICHGYLGEWKALMVKGNFPFLIVSFLYSLCFFLNLKLDIY